MTKEELSKLTDQELLVKAKEMKKAEMYSAFGIGFMIGIVVFSLIYNSWGLVTLIPLYFIYRSFKNPDQNAALKEVLAERGLKK